MNRYPQLSICRRLRSGVPNLHNRYKSCVPDHLVNGARTNQLPAILRINRTVMGTSGTGGMPAMIGIGGHLGPTEVMMKGGLRGHQFFSE